jgi:hypothetical protein
VTPFILAAVAPFSFKTLLVLNEYLKGRALRVRNIRPVLAQADTPPFIPDSINAVAHFCGGCSFFI